MKTYSIAGLVRLGAVFMLAVTLSACGKNDGDTQSPDNESSDAPMETKIRAETMAAEPALTCLMAVNRSYIAELMDPALRDKPRAGIPRDQLVLWHASENLFAAECPAESSDRVRTALVKEPYMVVNEAAKRWFLQQTVYTPGPKGEFEKTDDYNKRVASEKAAHEAAGQGLEFGAKDIELAWAASFGRPEIYTRGTTDDPHHYKYDPDSELLTFTILTRGPLIPVSVKLSPDAMQALLIAARDSYGRSDLGKLSLEVAMQYTDGKLTMRSIGFYSLSNNLKMALEALPVDVSTMPVNQEIPFHFGR